MNIEENNEQQSLKFNFSHFLSISKLDKIVNLFKSDPQKEIIQHAQFLLESKNYEAYGNLIAQGYVPTIKQQKIINKFVNTTLYNTPFVITGGCDKLYQSLEGLIGKGLKLNYENIMNFISSNYTDQLRNSASIKGNTQILNDKNHIIKGNLSSTKGKDYYYEITYPNLTKQFINIITQKEFSSYLLEQFEKSITENLGYYMDYRKNSARYTLIRYEEVLKNNPKIIFRNSSLEDVTRIIKKLSYHNISQEHTEILNNIVNHLYKKDMQEMVKQTKNTYADNSVKNLTIEKIRNEQYDMNDLPRHATDIINRIENLYTKIKQHKFEDTDKINTLNILFEKRIPEVLTKYLKVDPEYRTTLKSSQGKNAEDLMIDSLNNINDTFESVYQEINQNNVNSLSATNRYTKTLKM